jgi:iron(III) transport system permease protein
LTSVDRQNVKTAINNRGLHHRFFNFGTIFSYVSTTLIYFVFIILIGLPLLLVLMQTFFPDVFHPNNPTLKLSFGPLGRIFEVPRVYFAILHSIELASIVGLFATLLGGAFAVIVQRCEIPYRNIVSLIPWILFLTPAYLKTVAWVLLMSPGGYLAEWGLLPALSGSLFFSFPGLALVHTLGLFPFATFIIGNALRGLGSELEDAARLGGVPLWRVWFKINLPLLAPAFALSFITVFAQVLSDFGLASTIARMSNFGVLTYEIYAATSSYPIDFPLAGTQSLVLLLLVTFAVLFDRLLRQKDDLKLISGRSRPSRDYQLGSWRWVVTGLAFLVAFIALILPIGAVIIRALTRTLSDGMVLQNFTLNNIMEAMNFKSQAFAALSNSLRYAAIASFISCATAVLLALQLEGPGKFMRSSVMSIALASVAIPGIIFGFGYILMWNRLPGFKDISFPHYGDASLLVTGYIGVALPYALIVIMAAIGQLAPSLNDSARLFGVGMLRRLLRITLPLIAFSVLTGFILNFIHIMFELPISQMLIPRTESPAPIYILRLLNYDKDGLACALSLISMIIAGSAALFLWFAFRSFAERNGASNNGKWISTPSLVENRR